jgi:hypothetical protein
MSKDEEQGLKLTPNAISPGTFQDHMRGMERGGGTPQPEAPKPEEPKPEEPGTK